MFQVEGSWKMVPGELYFMIKIPAPTFFTSKEEGKKTGAVLHKHFFLNNPKKSYASCQGM